MSGAVLSRLPRSPTFRAWLPVAVLPPVLLAEALLTEKGPDVTAFGPVAAVVGCLPLVLRGRLGFLALGPLLTAGIVLILFALEPGNTVVLIPMVALADLAQRSDRRHNVWVGLAVVPCVVVSVLSAPYSPVGPPVSSPPLTASTPRNSAKAIVAMPR